MIYKILTINIGNFFGRLLWTFELVYRNRPFTTFYLFIIYYYLLFIIYYFYYFCFGGKSEET
jgi:hypothetical protein